MDHAAALRHLRRHDPALRGVIARHGPCGLQPHPRERWFQTLADAIISQQISARAAAAIGLRVRAALAPLGYLQPEHIAAASDAALAGTGLTRMKCAALRELAARVRDGRLRYEALASAPDAEAIRLLDDVRGIGEWTAQMFLMFGLGRMDVLPTADIGIRRAMQQVYELAAPPNPDNVREIARRGGWSPYTTVACWYLWRVAEPDGNPLW